MSQPQRLGIVVGAVIIAVAAFILFKPNDDDDKQTARDSRQTTEPSPATSRTEAAKPVPPPRPKAERLVVRSGEPVGGVRKITTRKGEVVRLTASSDVADEVHLHGYDISRPVAPGRDARFRFEATIEGIFEIELEERGVEIARLEVRP